MDSKYYVRRGLSSPKITRSFLPLWVCVQKYIMVLRVPLSTRWDAVGSNHMQPPTGFITGTEIEEIIIPTSKNFFFCKWYHIGMWTHNLWRLQGLCQNSISESDTTCL